MSRIAPVLHEGQQRDDEEAAEDADQYEIDREAPMPPAGDEGPDVESVRRTGRRGGGQREIEGKDREPERPERHEPELDDAAREPLAEHAADADADREERQQQRHDVLVAAEH